MESDLKYLFYYDLDYKKVIKNCTLNPTDMSKQDSAWLWALNTKYDEDDESEESDKVGKWMVFLPKAQVNDTWNKIKEAIKEGHLWHSKVSTSDPSDPDHAIMIYTKDYTDIDDVIQVLSFLETSGIKPANKVIKYKTDEQTRSGVYSSKKQKASIYDSDTIRQKREQKRDMGNWRSRDGSYKNRFF